MRPVPLASRRPRIASAVLALCGLMAGADGPPDPQPPAKPARSAINILEQTWPDHPEWAAMLGDILRGSQLGPGEGWFKKAVGKTRLTWDATRKALDKDGDDVVARPEFSGPDADFARLDRDRDGGLTEADFDFSAHALAPSPGAMLFYQADRDGDGKVTPEEFQAVFQRFDPDQAGFLSQDDLRRAFNPPPSRPVASPSQPEGPSRWILLKGLYRQEIGSLQPGPEPGETAPDFVLKTLDGRDEVQLSKLVGSRPVILVFGNFTCGPFRSQAGNVEKLHRRYKDRAHFAMVYVREAHPTDGWHMASNDRYGVTLAQPRTYEERTRVAQACGRLLDFGFPMGVDTLDDAVGSRYSGMPGRLYLIDRHGQVAYKSERGPFGFKPAELEHSLLLLLEQDRRNGAKSEARKPE